MRWSLVAAPFIFAGCIAPPNGSQRLTEAALEMNTATRFGRMDVALEHVGAKAREDFLERHATWGSRLRVVDVEFGGFEMQKSDEADVFLDVVWLKLDEATVRTTRLVQRWRDERGRWQLVDELHKDGSEGLLGEPEPAGEASGKPGDGAVRAPRLGFQTRVIHGD